MASLTAAMALAAAPAASLQVVAAPQSSRPLTREAIGRRWAAATLPGLPSAAAAAAGPAFLTAVVAGAALGLAARWRRRGAKANAAKVWRLAKAPLKFDFVSKDSSDMVGAFRKMPLTALEIGRDVEGVVTRVYRQSMASVDIGAEIQGSLDCGEWCDGFALPEERLREGDRVHGRILENDGKRFYITCRTGDLTRIRRRKNAVGSVADFAKVPADQFLHGTVQGIATWGVIVDVAPPNGGAVHSGKVHRKNFCDSFYRECTFGAAVKVRIIDCDLEANRLELSMTDSASLAPLQEQGAFNLQARWPEPVQVDGSKGAARWPEEVEDARWPAPEDSYKQGGARWPEPDDDVAEEASSARWPEEDDEPEDGGYPRAGAEARRKPEEASRRAGSPKPERREARPAVPLKEDASSARWPDEEDDESDDGASLRAGARWKPDEATRHAGSPTPKWREERPETKGAVSPKPKWRRGKT